MKENNQTEYTPPDNSTPPDTNPPLVLDIDIKGNAFGSPDITIGQGTTLKWTNKDSVDHTVTSDTGIVLDSELLSKGDSFSHTFNDLGTFEYHCSVHSGMKGKVIVKPAIQVPTI
jgi:plastocyanin